MAVGLFVDTSAWSQAFRRKDPGDGPIVSRLGYALDNQERVAATGLVLQELMQGLRSTHIAEEIQERMAAISMLAPTRTDHLHAAEIADRCRRSGVQLSTIDALLAALCIGNDLVMLSADRDFEHAAAVVPLQVWKP